MKIEVLVKGDPDVQPFTKTFDYEKIDLSHANGACWNYFDHNYADCWS